MQEIGIKLTYDANSMIYISKLRSKYRTFKKQNPIRIMNIQPIEPLAIQTDALNANQLHQRTKTDSNAKLAEQLIVEKRDSISTVENEAKTEAH